MIYLLTGENTYAIAERVARIKNDFKGDKATGIEEIAGDSLEPEYLPTLLGGGSLFSEKRLVVLNEPGANKYLNEPLVKALESVADDVSLVLVETKPDKRLRWYKIAVKLGKVEDFRNLNEGQLVIWLIDQAESIGAALQRPAASHLIRRAGTNQWRLSRELTKLATYNPKIEVKHIDALVEPSFQETVFELLDLIVQGQTKKANDMYLRLSAGELDPHQLIGLLAWQLHTLLVVITNKDKSAAQLAVQAKLAPFVVQRMQNLSRRLNLAKLKKIIRLTLEADAGMKTTNADASRLAEQLISKISLVVTS